jgi:FkbM family methyltransferase
MPEVETRYGRIAVPDITTDVIGRFLEAYGEWAWCETQFVASVLPKGARLLDVGAFIGTFGLGVGLTGKLAFLCCVEANPAIVGVLRANLADRAGFPAMVVEAMVAGAGDQPHRGTTDPGNLGATSYASGTGDAAVPLAATTLAELRRDHGPFDLIKLDIEGLEFAALQSDASHLALGGTPLWIECNEHPDSIRLAELLLSWKLDVYYFAFPSHNRANFNANAAPIFPMAFEAGLLAAPVTVPVLDAALQAQGCILRRIETAEALRAALWRTPRWGNAAWTEAGSREELAALVGRELKGEVFERFLMAGDGRVAQTIWEQLAATEAGLAEAQALLEAERGARSRESAALEEMKLLAVARLGEVEAERARRVHTEQMLEEAQARLEGQAGVLAAALEAQRQADIALTEWRMRAARDAALAERRVADMEAQLTRERAEAHKALRRKAEVETELARTAGRLLVYVASLGEANECSAVLTRQLETERREAADRDAAARLAALRYAEDREEDLRYERAKVELAEERLRRIQDSTSWRLTAPVRAVLDQQAGLKAVIRRGRRVAGAALRPLRHR